MFRASATTLEAQKRPKAGREPVRLHLRQLMPFPARDVDRPGNRAARLTALILEPILLRNE